MKTLEEKLNTIIKDLCFIKDEIKIIKSSKSDEQEEFVDTQQICEKLKITKNAVKKYRQRKVFPYYKMNGKVLFKMSEIIKSFNYHHNGSNRSQ